MIVNLLSAQEKCTSILYVETNEPDSKIYLNNEVIGEGSVEIKIEKGNYALVVKQSLRGWGSEVFKDSIFAESCDELFKYSYKFGKTILIESEPDDAAVINSDSTLGYTPMRINPNFQKLVLEKHGYTSKQITLKDVKNNYRIPLEFINLKIKKPFTQKPLFKILIGSAIALGATAAYLKLEADDKFDRYLETRQQEYLDETDRLDLYSGLAFGALQINFGALLYFFLFD